jgi:DNA helicase-2/ATP-dependent DNA helicase PcrA
MLLNTSVMIDVSENDIAYAEKILLDVDKHFDDERLKFIKDFATLDLQAVPGSGKTTALLAKLLILETKLPLINDRAVLVLSHTNTAIDEIKSRIGKYCPKLFSYPHFIGTIQSFVDVFLAIPCYTNKFKQKPYRIDNEIYSEKITTKLNSIWLFRYGYSPDFMKKIGYLKNLNEGLFHKIRLGFDENAKLILLDKLNGKKIEIKKPRGRTRAANYNDYNDYSNLEKTNIYNWLIKFKKDIIKKDGVLHFDDAYFLAEFMLLKIPNSKNIIRQRFNYVFIDEMQDMDLHQYNLLEKIFFCNDNPLCSLQRIGDVNQAIFNGFSDSEGIWEFRENTRYINGSYRLSPKVASIVEKLSLTHNPIEGRNTNPDGSEIIIKPTLILYNNENKEQVIESFATKISELIATDLIPEKVENIYQVVAWRKEHSDENKMGLKDYYPNYNGNSIKTKIDYLCLKDYLIHFDKEKGTLESIRKNILNAFLRVLRTENIKDQYDRQFTKRKLINNIKQQSEIEYEKFKLNLYNWSIGVIKGDINIIDEVRLYIPELLAVFEKSIDLSASFINNEPESQTGQEEEVQAYNEFNFEGIDIKVGTVHSVKGQTNTASLYLETYFQKDGNGANAKSYESQRLSAQFLGNQLNGRVGKRVSQSAKMTYVGFSRPTHLLCVGIHKDRFDSCLTEIDENIWDIVEI